MKLSEEQLRALLSLKRHEKPPASYIGDFLREFHLRLRDDGFRDAGGDSLWRRFGDWLAEPGLARWAYGAGLAYAGVLMAVILLPHEVPVEGPPLQPVNHPVVLPARDAPAESFTRPDLAPSLESLPDGTPMGEREF